MELESLRTLCYDDADVFLVCFSVVRLSSFDAVASRWLPEIRRLCPSTPVILVGTQCDRTATDPGPSVADDSAAALAARVGAIAYLPCSAALTLGVKDVFDACVAVTLRRRALVTGSGGCAPCRRWLTRLIRCSSRDANSHHRTCNLSTDSLHALRSNGSRKCRWKRLLCCMLN